MDYQQQNRAVIRMRRRKNGINLKKIKINLHTHTKPYAFIYKVVTKVNRFVQMAEWCAKWTEI